MRMPRARSASIAAMVPGNDVGMVAHGGDVHRLEHLEDRVDIALGEVATMSGAPGDCNRWNFADSANVIPFRHAHWSARIGDADCDAELSECAHECAHWRAAAVVHHGAGPVQDGSLDFHALIAARLPRLRQPPSMGPCRIAAKATSILAMHAPCGSAVTSMTRRRRCSMRTSRWFLHQALSTPCLNVVERAEGIYLIDTAGRRIMDFHGNTVHQVGYGHPRVIEAVTRQLATLPFSPRRYTNRAAIELARRLAELAPGRLNKVLFAPSGTAAIGMALKLARHATGRHKTVSMWDAFHGASLDAISVGGEAIFRRDAGPLLPGTEHVPPPAMAPRFFGDDGRAHERLADYIDYVLEVQGDVGGGDRRTGALDNVGGAACGFLAARARKLRPSWCAADLRRNSELPGTHRHDVRVRAGGVRAGHAGAGQRSGWRRVPDGGADRSRGSGCRGRSRAGALHA